MEKSKVLNIDILQITKNELLIDMNHRLKETKPTGSVLVTPNLDHLVKLQHDKDFWDVYCNADWVVCDSKILYLALKIGKRFVPEAIPGSSFFTSFYEYHKEDVNCRIFLLGAMNNVAEKAKKRINEKIGRDIIVGAYSPSFGFENKQDECKRIYDLINKSDATVVLVGVGAPKQEKWIMHHKNYMPHVKIWMALGATIDFEAGNIKRAPKFFQKFALEWLYRMYCEPKRMFKRYICDDLAFFIYYIKDILRIYKNPFCK